VGVALVAGVDIAIGVIVGFTVEVAVAVALAVGVGVGVGNWPPPMSLLRFFAETTRKRDPFVHSAWLFARFSRVRQD
jgi:hypothetical protein